MVITGESIGLMTALQSLTVQLDSTISQLTALQSLVTGLMSACILLVALCAFMAIVHR